MTWDLIKLYGFFSCYFKDGARLVYDHQTLFRRLLFRGGGVMMVVFHLGEVHKKKVYRWTKRVGDSHIYLC